MFRDGNYNNGNGIKHKLIILDETKCAHVVINFNFI